MTALGVGGPASYLMKRYVTKNDQELANLNKRITTETDSTRAGLADISKMVSDIQISIARQDEKMGIAAKLGRDFDKMDDRHHELALKMERLSTNLENFTTKYGIDLRNCFDRIKAIEETSKHRGQ